ncbi:tetratricopeptide (TPR) repeat protein [Actinoplanes tereljensis]|uniref:FxSxx-COOH system tetratricopeptide repeat protein n=1 Tax=Paractinoplanes tereljensis TaxID=571912 RepID=UPI001940CD7A|nr:FxSxx-COOH system tetratricopeptide repeat protein [Actinoplanes tereljensis]
MPRIFISHAGRDRAWAEWARWHLDAAGYETELDSVDWAAGTNFVEAMHRALSRQNPMLILLSSAYLEPDRFTTDEWTARLAQRRADPETKLIPLRIDRVDLRGGLWAPIIVPEVFGLSADRAVGVLLDSVGQVSAPPGDGGRVVAPPYPGGPSTTETGGPRPPGSLPRLWNLARRNPAFTGRDAMLNRLYDTLGSNRRAAVQALHGTGGVGKTQLALEYAHRFAGEYDLVWWIPSERPELIGDHLADLATKAGQAVAGTATPDAVDALGQHLRGRSRWLLIFDNAEDRDDLVRWLPDGPGHLIITSRNPGWTGVAQPMDVDVFTRSESTALLHSYLPHLDDRNADRLADALGDLPLAIGQAADLLAETHIDIDAYLAALRMHAADLLGDSRPPIGYPAPLASSVAVAAQRLAGDDPAAGQLLALCAHLGPEPIPADLFTGRPDLLQPPLAELARRTVAFGRTVAKLRQYGLARIVDGGPLLHRLTQAVLRDTDPESVAHRHTVEGLLIAARPENSHAPAWWPRWAQLLPHILALDPAVNDNPDIRLVANEAVWFLLARGDAGAALPLAEQLHAAWAERHGPDDDATLEAANNLARAYNHFGRYREARDLHEDALARKRRLLGDEHRSTLRSATNLIATVTLLGEHEQARELGEEMLARCRRVLGHDDGLTLGAADNFAGALRALKDYEHARALDEDTLAQRRRTLGNDHPDTLRSAHNLADHLRALGRFEQAREADEETLAGRRRVLGDDHSDTLRSVTSLAIDLRALGEYERARELDEDTLARRRRKLGDRHPNTIWSARNLADDLEALGRHAEAEQLRSGQALP